MSKGQIWGNSNESQLEVIRKYGIKASITDLGVLTGRTSYFYTKSADNGNVCMVDNHGFRSAIPRSCHNGVIRPVLQSSSIFSKISSNRMAGYNGTEEVEYGEYPQNAAASKMQIILESEYYDDRLNETKASYTFNSAKWGDDVGFKLETYKEYEYQGKKYVRVKANPCVPFFSDDDYKFKLSNGVEYKKGDYIWVEVSPVIWLIDDETELLISKKGLASGIRFLDRNTKYKGNFDETEMKEYLDKCMLPELTQSITSIHTKGITLKKMTEFEDKKMDKAYILKLGIMRKNKK